MAETYEVIVVGEVLKDPPEQYYREDGTACPLPYMVYKVGATGMISSRDVQAAEPLAVAVLGGQHRVGCGSPEGTMEPIRPAYSLAGGRSYVFFLQHQGDNGLDAYVGERFEIGDDGRVMGNGTEAYNAGPAALVGAGVDEATQALLAAIAEAPLPEIPTWLQPYVTPPPDASPSPAATD